MFKFLVTICFLALSRRLRFGMYYACGNNCDMATCTFDMCSMNLAELCQEFANNKSPQISRNCAINTEIIVLS